MAINETLTVASKVLKKKTMDKIITDERVTDHGLKILERWARDEGFILKDLERKPEKFMAVLLEQQKNEHPTTYDNIQQQLRNGLTAHELRELGAPDLSCRHAIWRMSLTTN